MSEDEKKERRVDNAEIKQDVALIKNDVSYIKQFIEEDRKKFSDHLQSAESYRQKVDSLLNVDTLLKQHTDQDRWLFGLMFTIQIAIFTKVVGIW